jgi:hypothetical protein
MAPKAGLRVATRIATMSFLVALWIACGSTGRRTEPDAGKQNAKDAGEESVYVNPGCPVSISPGCPGNVADAAGCPTTFICQPLPTECTDNLTCDCVACSSKTCATCNVVGNGRYTNNTGGAAICSYANDRFIVECINP